MNELHERRATSGALEPVTFLFWLCGFLKVCVIRLGNTGVRDPREQVSYLTPYNRIVNHKQNNPYYLLECIYL